MTWERFAADMKKMDAEMERLRAALADRDAELLRIGERYLADGDEIRHLRAALEREQNDHANCEDVNAQRFQTLTDTIIDLTQQVTAMRPIVEAVALREMFTPTYPPAGPSLYRCQWCHATGRNQSRFKHHEDCQVVKACAIFGIKSSESEA